MLVVLLATKPMRDTQNALEHFHWAMFCFDFVFGSQSSDLAHRVPYMALVKIRVYFIRTCSSFTDVNVNRKKEGKKTHIVIINAMRTNELLKTINQADIGTEEEGAFVLKGKVLLNHNSSSHTFQLR